MASALLLLCALPSQAQNVTVKASNGSTLAAVKGSGADDTFFNLGGFSMWKHNQLNLSMTTSDKDDGFALTDIGQFANPANNIFKASSGDALIIGRGMQMDCYVALSLPKGYRFTGYTIVFRRNANIESGTGGNAAFGEVTKGAANQSWNWYSSDTHKENLRYSTSAARQTITRESKTDDDMGNVLYFKLSNTYDNRAFITLESVELFFTAEADYTPVVPAGIFANRTAVDVPFSTSCVDLGPIEDRVYNGTHRVSYTYQNVKDLMAKMHLYEAESVEAGTAFDGTSGNVVAYNDGGTISSEDDFFKVGRSKGEQVYYLETPTYIELNNNARTKNPIGYRIVGAEIKYKYGEARGAYSEDVTEEVLVESTLPTFYISGKVETWYYSWGWHSSGTATYYLTSTAGMTTDENQKAAWFIDEEGYIRLASDPDKYLKNETIENTKNRLTVVEKSGSPAKFTRNSNGQITLQANPNMYLCLNTSSESYFWVSHITDVNYFQMINNGSEKATSSNSGSNITINEVKNQTHTVNFDAFEPAPFTLKVYDKTGETVVDEVEVDENTADGSIKLEGLNNDAVKFSVEGVGLVQAVVTIQALNPYIDRIDIVCQEAQLSGDTYTPTGNGRELVQTFNASDFAVSGGAFHFYVPEDFQLPCLFSFENLFSKYGDNTYYDNGSATGNSRYNFVMSDYWKDNADLYATTYNPDHPYTDKISAEIVGDHAYKFNNAAEVGSTGGTYQEYPFTLERYGGTDKFQQMVFEQNELTGQKKTAYLFSCDETRYNIATATATQHRSYAFYQMDITAAKKTYSPVFNWKKVYDKSCYLASNGSVIEKPQWGLEVLTENIGTATAPEYGYVTVSQILKGIEQGVSTANAPESKDLILYIDGSKLLSIVEDKKTAAGEGEEATRFTLENLKEGLGANVLVYLPEGTTSTTNNYAYMTSGKTFRSANNIVLTDKQPFFAPYAIQVPSANSATYTRLITADMNGQVQNATVMLPFKLTVNDQGVHFNSDESSFQLHKLAKLNVDQIEDVRNFDGDGVFTPIQASDGQAPANTPYMVRVLNGVEPNSTYSFKVTQYGADIVATPQSTKIEGETVNGIQVGSNNGSLKNWGTYSGETLDKNLNIFYFTQNKYVSSLNLSAKYPSVYVQPFRAYYTSSGLGSAGAKMMNAFNIIYDFVEDDTATGIDATIGHGPFTLVPGNGALTVRANENVNVRIVSLNGNSIARMNMQAGDRQSVNLPAGVYLVNNQKVVIR